MVDENEPRQAEDQLEPLAENQAAEDSSPEAELPARPGEEQPTEPEAASPEDIEEAPHVESASLESVDEKAQVEVAEEMPLEAAPEADAVDEHMPSEMNLTQVDQETDAEVRLGEGELIEEAPVEVLEAVTEMAPELPAAKTAVAEKPKRKPKAPKAEESNVRLTDEGGPDFSQVPQPDGDSDGRAWYVVHCYSGYENKVRHNLEQRIESMGMKDKIFDVVVPTEEEIEVKEGKRRTVERRVFPGYILVNMILSEESWYVVRNTPGVTSFVGQGNTPLPLRPEEVSQIVKRMEAEAPRIKVTFRQGERVRIVDGPFNDFRGTVSEIDMERAKVRVMVNFFGRETPVELDFLQVEKA
jgi:transcriptional antiterminator NusG